MLTLSKVLCSHPRTTNSISFSALLKVEKDRGRHPFVFLLCDPEDHKVAIPCVFHPLCFKALPITKLFKGDVIFISVEIWCLVFQRNYKFIEITSVSMTEANDNKTTKTVETEVVKEGIVIGKSSLFDDRTFFVHLLNRQDENVIYNETQSPYLLAYNFISPGMCISFSDLPESNGNGFCATEKTSITSLISYKGPSKGTDSFSGRITEMGFVTSQSLFHTSYF